MLGFLLRSIPKKFLYYIRDYGLLDKPFSLVTKKETNRNIGDPVFKRTDVLLERTGEVWVCFLPWGMGFKEAIHNGFIPKNCPVYVYEGPFGIVNPLPTETRKLLATVCRDLELLDLKKFNVLGYSVGTYFAFYIANHFPVGRLIAVTPGSRLGSSIWKGVATQEVRARSEALGIKSAKEYDSVLQGTNPIDNLDTLPEDIEIHIATHDRYIPAEFAEELVSSLEKKYKPKIVRHRGRGHVMTISRFLCDTIKECY